MKLFTVNSIIQLVFSNRSNNSSIKSQFSINLKMQQWQILSRFVMSCESILISELTNKGSNPYATSKSACLYISPDISIVISNVNNFVHLKFTGVWKAKSSLSVLNTYLLTAVLSQGHKKEIHELSVWFKEVLCHNSFPLTYMFMQRKWPFWLLVYCSQGTTYTTHLSGDPRGSCDFFDLRSHIKLFSIEFSSKHIWLWGTLLSFIQTLLVLPIIRVDLNSWQDQSIVRH